MVTVPGFTGCRYCRWLPRVRASDHPFTLNSRIASLTLGIAWVPWLGRMPERTINASTIADEARRTGNGATDDPEQRAEALVRVIALAKWGLQQTGGLIDADGRRTKPVIAADKVEVLRGRYQEGERLAFRVTCRVRGKPNTFRVFLERDDNLTVGHDYYVRGHLHIPRMDYLTRHGARALVVVDNTSDLGHLLRDSEGPSHEGGQMHQG